MKLTLDELERCFINAGEERARWIVVEVATDGYEATEFIFNHFLNFSKKLEYYKNAYAEDLVLKSYNGVKIVGFAYGSNLDETLNNLSIFRRIGEYGV